MADLWTGFDLNEPGAEDDDDAAAFDLDEHDAAAFDLNMPPMEDQNNNGNGLSFYDIHSSHAKVLRAY